MADEEREFTCKIESNGYFYEVTGTTICDGIGGYLIPRYTVVERTGLLSKIYRYFNHDKGWEKQDTYKYIRELVRNKELIRYG